MAMQMKLIVHVVVVVDVQVRLIGVKRHLYLAAY